MSRKLNSFKPVKSVVPETGLKTETVLNNISKWVPLMCAAAAAGISVIALKEIKCIKNDLIILKKEQNLEPNQESNQLLSKKMEKLEEQLKTITDYLKNKNNIEKRKIKIPEIIKNVLPQEQTEVKIINEDEYEEVEVTDDENEETDE